MGHNHIVGCLLGTALGDSIGLPYEGLSRQRSGRLLGPPDRHRFFFGKGMVSDDTEHTCLVAQSLIASGGDVEVFRQSLSWQLRFWFASIPAGIGMATARAIIRLWFGVSPLQSGVFSAGNGPAMRAAIIGAAIDDRKRMAELIRASSRMTHTDPKAEFGAQAVALAAHMTRSQEGVTSAEFLNELRATLGDAGNELVTLIADVASSVANTQSTQSFAESLGLSQGVTGYVYHSVPVAIHAWLTNPGDIRRAIMSVVECGGDTDTTAAIVGGIIGTGVGDRGLPSDWLSGLSEWPCSVVWMKRLGIQLHQTLSTNSASRPVKRSAWAIVPRNLFFLMIVLAHGFRRLFPPY